MARKAYYPQQSAHEDLVIYWLWSRREGVFSHDTALSLHQLSDTLPARAYMTIPNEWSHRRRRVPAVVTLAFGAVAESERQRIDGVPVTMPARTVNDCALAHVAPELVQQAVREGLERKLFVEGDVRPALHYVQAYAA